MLTARRTAESLPAMPTLPHRPRPAPLTMGGREWALLLVLAGLWSGSFLFFAVALEALPPLTVVLGRVGLAAPALLLVLAATGQRLPADWRPRRPFPGMGALNNALPLRPIARGPPRI